MQEVTPVAYLVMSLSYICKLLSTLTTSGNYFKTFKAMAYSHNKGTKNGGLYTEWHIHIVATVACCATAISYSNKNLVTFTICGTWSILNLFSPEGARLLLSSSCICFKELPTVPTA